MNGTCPDSIWYMTTPSEYTSERVSPTLTHPLFRRHVERCSPLCASLCHRQHVRGVRYPEVDQLNHAVRVKRRQQHVLGLDVVVSDAMPAGARRFEREGRLMREGDGSAYIQRSSVNKLADRVRDVLYNQEVGTVVLADVDDARNVRMIDGRDYPSFTLKARDNFERCQVRMQHLQRDLAFEIGIIRVIDCTLAARRQISDDPVLANHLSGCVRHNSPRVGGIVISGLSAMFSD